MQATYQLKPFPFQIVVFVCGLLAAAIIGGLGGYWVKSLDHRASAGGAATITVRVPSMVGENARTEAVLGTHTTVGNERAASRAQRDDVIGSAQQPSLTGENAQAGPAEKAPASGRR